jgi:integrase
MPRALPYLQTETTRHGKTVYFVRFGKGPRIRIKGDYGTAEFMAAYNAALATAAPESKQPAKDKRSLAWLISRYQETTAWTKFQPATQRQCAAILRQVIDRAGTAPFKAIEKRHIMTALDERRHTPHQADHFLKVMRGLFSWALKAGEIDADPTHGVEFTKAESDGHHPWTAEEISRFETRWPIGTPERLAMAVLFFTGLRLGDAVTLGRQHIREGWIRIATEKTGEIIDLPLAPELADIIAATPTTGLALISTEAGVPRTKAGFGNWFRDACMAAGVPGRAHGLRKALATMAAESGATETELEAMFGWRDRETSMIYTKAASRKKQAAEGMRKALEGRKKNDPAPHLLPETPHLENSSKKSGG